MTLRLVLITLLLVATLAPVSSAQPTRPTQQDEFVPISDLPPQEQLPSQPLVVAAYAFAWLAIGGYVLSVARRLDVVQREIQRLETDTKRSR